MGNPPSLANSRIYSPRPRFRPEQHQRTNWAPRPPRPRGRGAAVPKHHIDRGTPHRCVLFFGFDTRFLQVGAVRSAVHFESGGCFGYIVMFAAESTAPKPRPAAEQVNSRIYSPRPRFRPEQHQRTNWAPRPPRPRSQEPKENTCARWARRATPFFFWGSGPRGARGPESEAPSFCAPQMVRGR